jgi:hypothetical protein
LHFEVDFEEVIVENADGEVVGARGADGTELEPLATVEMPSTVAVGVYFKDTPMAVAADAKLITEQTLIAVNALDEELPANWASAHALRAGDSGAPCGLVVVESPPDAYEMVVICVIPKPTGHVVSRVSPDRSSRALRGNGPFGSMRVETRNY